MSGHPIKDMLRDGLFLIDEKARCKIRSHRNPAAYALDLIFASVLAFSSCAKRKARSRCMF
jgi:hypothetical protein